MTEIIKLEDIKHKYDDIINLPHHVSIKHKQMSIESRAAQFAPFAALTGYSDEIKETARLTHKKIEINEDLKEIIDSKLQIIQSRIKDNPSISVTYFIPDNKKNGGRYETINKCAKRIDEVNKIIIFVDKCSINIDNIIDIQIKNAD